MEGYGLSRNELIYEIEKLGPKYKWEKYTDQQLFRIYNRLLDEKNTEPLEPLLVVQKPTCDTCGRTLTDGGYCRFCDDNDEEDLDDEPGLSSIFNI